MSDSEPEWESSPRPSRRKRLWIGAGAVAAAALIVYASVNAVSSAPPSTEAEPAALSSPMADVATSSATPEVLSPTGSSVEVQCSTADGEDISVTMDADWEDRFSFSDFWTQHAEDCEVTAADGADLVSPAGPVEEAALKASGYTDDDISTLFTICAGVGEDYGSEGTLSADQAAEISGALVLCPNHPDRAAWRKAIKRGQQGLR